MLNFGGKSASIVTAKNVIGRCKNMQDLDRKNMEHISPHKFVLSFDIYLPIKRYSFLYLYTKFHRKKLFAGTLLANKKLFAGTPNVLFLLFASTI